MPIFIKAMWFVSFVLIVAGGVVAAAQAVDPNWYGAMAVLNFLAGVFAGLAIALEPKKSSD